jgi:hypothetical protein
MRPHALTCVLCHAAALLATCAATATAATVTTTNACLYSLDD